MASYYADSSVLVKQHIPETGSTWVRALTAPAAGNAIFTAHISVAEVYSAFNRRIREATLSTTTYATLVADFDALWSTIYNVTDVNAAVVARTRQLTEQHPLRAYDAVQLAAALIVNDTLLAASLPALTFLSADTRLLAAAAAEGLATDDPNTR